MNKIIIVEGKTDKEKILTVLDEPVDIICTYGTANEAKLEALILEYEGREIYTFFDTDHSGDKLRKQIKQITPNVTHLFTLKMYRQVANTPQEYLKDVLMKYHFVVKK